MIEENKSSLLEKVYTIKKFPFLLTLNQQVRNYLIEAKEFELLAKLSRELKKEARLLEHFTYLRKSRPETIPVHY